MNTNNNKSYFNTNDTSSTVREIQTMLYNLSLEDSSLPRIYPDGIFGPETEEAVSIFQEQNSLPVTGRVNYETWIKLREKSRAQQDKYAEPDRIAIFPDATYVTTPGESSITVAVIQIVLKNLCNHLPLDEPELNGTFDEKTQHTVSQYQKIRNLPEDGLVDKKTWNAMAADHYRYEINTKT